MEYRNLYPIILAHGIARPDFLIDSVIRSLNLTLYDFGLISDRFHYFRGIASYLRKHGFRVWHSNVSFAADVETRAQDLKQEVLRILEQEKSPKVHIIAHSMGGLDARYMIVFEKMASFVASLTTIGTPHFGTPVADVVLQKGLGKLLPLFRAFINLDGISSVTTYNMRFLNQEMRDAEASNEVFYQAFYSRQDQNRVFFLFQKSWEILQEKEGENDGLVSVRSQKWVRQLVSDTGKVKNIRQVAFPMKADHLEQVGWWNMNKMVKVGWWNIFALRERIQNENRIKEIYLRIAEELLHLEKDSRAEIQKKRKKKQNIRKVP